MSTRTQEARGDEHLLTLAFFALRDADGCRFETRSGPLFSSFDEVVDRSDLFVIGLVDGVRPGRMVGHPALPLTNVDLAVIQVALGSTARGAVLTVEQTGGVYHPTHAASDARLRAGSMAFRSAS